MIKLLSAAAICLVSAVGAQAATYNLTYAFTATGDVVGASFEGDLQGDGNTILMTAANDDLTLNGVDFVPSAGAMTTLIPFLGGAPTVALDGSFADFVYTNATISEGFALLSGVTAQYFEFSTFTSIISDGTLSVSAAPVPLPAALPLLGAGLGLLVVARRRA